MHIRKNEPPTAKTADCDAPASTMMVSADVIGTMMRGSYREVIIWAERHDMEIHECGGHHYIPAHEMLRYMLQDRRQAMTPGQALSILTAKFSPWTTPHTRYPEDDESVIALRNSIVLDAQLNEPFGTTFSMQGRVLLDHVLKNAGQRAGA